jgi:hypothetical protein
MFTSVRSKQSCFDSLLNLRERLIELSRVVLSFAGA